MISLLLDSELVCLLEERLTFICASYCDNHVPIPVRIWYEFFCEVMRALTIVFSPSIKYTHQGTKLALFAADFSSFHSEAVNSDVHTYLTMLFFLITVVKFKKYYSSQKVSNV